MGVLISKENQRLEFVLNKKIILVDTELMNLINNLVSAVKEHHALKSKLKDKESHMLEAQNRLRIIIEQQTQIEDEIQKILASKHVGYDTLMTTLSAPNLTKANQSLSTLVDKLKQNDFQVAQINIQIKFNDRIQSQISKTCLDLETKIQSMRQFFVEKYGNIDSTLYNPNNIVLSLCFDEIKSDELKGILSSITKKNFEFERLIVKMLYKLCTKILMHENYQKVDETWDEIITLININNMVYEFVLELVSRKDVSVRTVSLFPQLESFVESLVNYAKNSVNTDKRLNISSSIIQLKSLSELQKAKVIKSCRPSIFYKKELETFQLDYYRIDAIIEQMRLYIESLELKQNIKTKKLYN